MTLKPDQEPIRVQVDTTPCVVLFPVRYALGDNQSRTPDIRKVAGNFQVNDRDGNVMPCDADTHYTLRRLRDGYLHVFREEDQRWSSFIVSSDGRIKTLLLDPKTGMLPTDLQRMNPDRLENLRSRMETMRYTSSGLLIIPKKKPVWLCFSDAPMTARTMQKAQDEEAFRKCFMRKFDPNAWKGTTHTALLGESGKQVTACVQKFVPPVADLTRGIKPEAFWYSQESFPRTTLKELKEGIANPEVVKDWAVLALEDPAGMTMDLSSLMAGRLESWLLNLDPKCSDKRTTKWAMLAGKAIAGVQEVVLAQAEKEAILDEDSYKQTSYEAAKDLEAQFKREGMDPAKAEEFRKSAESFYGKYYDDKEITKRAKVRATEAWKQYSGKYDSVAHENWMKDFDSRLKTFDKDFILPLANMHVAWCDSKRFAAYFNGAFDPQDAGSGLLYTETMTFCYAGVQDKLPCYNHMVAWLQKDITKENLLLRALVLNMEETRKNLQKLTNQVESAGLPWDKVINGHKDLTEYVLEYKGSVLSRFFAATLGPLGAVMMKGLESDTTFHAMLALGVASELPMVKLYPRATRKAFGMAATGYFLRQHPERFKNSKAINRLKAELEKEFKIKKIQGYPLDEMVEGRVVAYLDVEQAKNIPKGQDAAKWAAQHIKTLEEVEQLNLSGWREKVHLKISGAGSRLKSGIPMFGGLVAGLAQYISMSKSMKDLEGTMARDRKMSMARIASGAGDFAGTVIEMSGMSIEKAGIRFSKASMARFGRIMARVGAGIGCAASLVMAVMDVIDGYNEFKKGNRGLAAAYWIGGISGGGASICFLLFAFGLEVSWIPIAGWILAGIAFITAIIIALIKNNKLQDWLEQCTWGTQKKYEHMEDELRELNLSLAG